MAVVDELVTLLNYKLDERGASTLKAYKTQVVDVAKKVAALSVAVIAGKTAFQGWFHGILEQSMQLERLSQSTGMTTDAMQAWSFGIKQIGGDAKSALSNLREFQLALNPIGVGEYNQKLQRWFPVVDPSAPRDLSDTLTRVSKTFQKWWGEGENGRLNTFRVGRDIGLNDDNITQLAKGPAGLKKVMEEFRSANASIGTDGQIKANSELYQSWIRLRESVRGYAHQVGNVLTPYIKGVVDKTNDWISANRDLHEQHMKDLAEVPKEAPGVIGKWWQSEKDGWAGVKAAFQDYVSEWAKDYPALSEWIKGLGWHFKNAFKVDMEGFRRFFDFIKGEGKGFSIFLKGISDSISLLTRAVEWLLDKFLSIFGFGKKGALDNNPTKPEDPGNRINAKSVLEQFFPGWGKSPIATQPSVVVPKTTVNNGAPVNNHYQIDMRIDGSGSPVATGKAVKSAMESYFFGPYAQNPVGAQ